MRGSSLNTPIMELVSVLFWSLLTPRMVIHMCLQEMEEGGREGGNNILVLSGNATIRVDHRLHVYYVAQVLTVEAPLLYCLYISAYTQPHDQVLQKNNSFLRSYVRCLHYDGHTSRVDGSQHSVRYLLSEPLLNCKWGGDTTHSERDVYTYSI